jgi:CO/xanthine dehydrogenase FAD-binding subunit
MLYSKYQVAGSLIEAVNLLANIDSKKKRIVAGGTDLVLQLHEHLHKADILVDVSRVPEMLGIHQEGDQIVIGAATTFTELARSPIIREQAYLLVEASKQIGAAQIQNMATIGGNIGNASPAADTIPCLYALQAEVILARLGGERVVSIDQFHQAYRKIDLRPDELIRAIRFPILPKEAGTAFYKYALRKSQAISVVNAAAVLHLQSGRIIDSAVSLGAVAPTIIRSPAAEQVLLGQIPSVELFFKAGEAARQDAHPIDDIRGSASFRRYLVGVCANKAIQAAYRRCKVINQE